jgi:hypothetical protein
MPPRMTSERANTPSHVKLSMVPSYRAPEEQELMRRKRSDMLACLPPVALREPDHRVADKTLVINGIHIVKHAADFAVNRIICKTRYRF